MATPAAKKLKKLIVNIEADPPIGGVYELEPKGPIFFTNGELHLIKVETGIRPAQIDEAFAQLDTDVNVGFALVALQRAGLDHPQVRKMLWNLSGGIKVDAETEDDPEADALPPESELDENDSPSATA